MADKDDQQVKPAYVPFTTFANAVERLKANGIPTIIDMNSLAGSLAGGTRGMLRSGMRFLGLIDRDGAPRQPLLLLVKAHGTNDWAATLKTVMDKSYAPIMGDIDLSNATPAMVSNAFKEKGDVDGQVLLKAVRFYLAAMKASGVSLSAYLEKDTAAKARGGTKSGATRRRPKAKAEPADSGREPEVPSDFISHKFPLRSDLLVTISLPRDLTDADVTRLGRWLATLPMTGDLP